MLDAGDIHHVIHVIEVIAHCRSRLVLHRRRPQHSADQAAILGDFTKQVVRFVARAWADREGVRVAEDDRFLRFIEVIRARTMAAMGQVDEKTLAMHFGDPGPSRLGNALVGLSHVGGALAKDRRLIVSRLQDPHPEPLEGCKQRDVVCDHQRVLRPDDNPELAFSMRCRDVLDCSNN